MEVIEELINHRYYRLLIKAIEEHPFKKEMGFLHSSLIVRGGSVLAIGVNMPNQNGFIRSYSNFETNQVHSEFHCVNQIRRKIDLNGCAMYNCRITRSNKVAISKPCPACSQMIINYGFKKVVYTTDIGIEVLKISEIREIINDNTNLSSLQS